MSVTTYMRKYRAYVPFIILLFLSLIPLFDLFHIGLPVTHDGQDHVARIANFYQNLQEGNIVPRWAGNLNWGYGHPILMFLYPLSSYIASFFHFLGFSLIDSTKLVFIVTFPLSGFAMYLWVRAFLGEKAGFVASLLYMFAPYRFVDLYVRGAIGEHVAFVFPPLILYFILRLTTSSSIWLIVGGVLSLAGLILSHNAITLMFLPIFFFYSIYLLLYTKEKKLLAIRYTLLAVLGFGFSAFFWIPAFFEGKYTLRDIVTSGEYTSRFTQWKDFLYGAWSYGGSGQLSVQVGIVHWIVTVLAILLGIELYLRKNRLWVFVFGSLLIFLSTLFLMTVSSEHLWKSISILQKFQFPWRFLSVTVFVASLLGGVCIFLLSQKTQRVALSIVVIAALWFNKDYWHANGYLQKPESFYTRVYPGTTDTGESAPIWSVRFMLEEPKAPMEIIEGEATITQLARTSTSRLYTVAALSVTRLRENTLYFPGWIVIVDGEMVKDVQFQDPRHRGLITFFVSEGKHTVSVEFKETKLRLFANAISILSVLVAITTISVKTRMYVVKGMVF